MSEDVSFLNKASILKVLDQIPDNSNLTIDASDTKFIHFDVVEIIENFQINAKARHINVTLIDLYKNKQSDPIQHFEVID